MATKGLKMLGLGLVGESAEDSHIRPTGASAWVTCRPRSACSRPGPACCPGTGDMSGSMRFPPHEQPVRGGAAGEYEKRSPGIHLDPRAGLRRDNCIAYRMAASVGVQTHVIMAMPKSAVMPANRAIHQIAELRSDLCGVRSMG